MGANTRHTHKHAEADCKCCDLLRNGYMVQTGRSMLLVMNYTPHIVRVCLAQSICHGTVGRRRSATHTRSRRASTQRDSFAGVKCFTTLCAVSHMFGMCFVLTPFNNIKCVCSRATRTDIDDSTKSSTHTCTAERCVHMYVHNIQTP